MTKFDFFDFEKRYMARKSEELKKETDDRRAIITLTLDLSDQITKYAGSRGLSCNVSTDSSTIHVVGSNERLEINVLGEEQFVLNKHKNDTPNSATKVGEYSKEDLMERVVLFLRGK